MRYNALYPELLVSNLEKSLKFYLHTLGFKCEYERTEEHFVFLSYGDAQIMLIQDNNNQHSRTGDLAYPRGQGINFSICCQSVKSIVDSLNGIKHPLRIPVRDQWHRVGNHLKGERQLWVMDPDGYLLRFIEDLGEKPISN